MNGFVSDLGQYPVNAKMFILTEMQQYNVAILLFNLIFDVVLFIFLVISVLLIYSLLMIGLETKTFETGIMRMVGITKYGLVCLIFIQSLLFVLPAILLAFGLSFPLLAWCYSRVFKESLRNGFEPVPTISAIVYALIVGFLIPLLSSIVPVFKVLGQDLNDALNQERSRLKAFYVEILSSTQKRIVPYLVFAVLTCGYGIAIYYFLPLSMLTYNFGLILKVFLMVLIGLLLGLTMLSLNA